MRLSSIIFRAALLGAAIYGVCANGPKAHAGTVSIGQVEVYSNPTFSEVTWRSTEPLTIDGEWLVIPVGDRVTFQFQPGQGVAFVEVASAGISEYPFLPAVWNYQNDNLLTKVAFPVFPITETPEISTLGMMGMGMVLMFWLAPKSYKRRWVFN